MTGRLVPTGQRCTCCQREELLDQDGIRICVACDMLPDTEESELERIMYGRLMRSYPTINDEGAS